MDNACLCVARRQGQLNPKEKKYNYHRDTEYTEVKKEKKEKSFRAIGNCVGISFQVGTMPYIIILTIHKNLHIFVKNGIM